jgi:hypothetical protein
MRSASRSANPLSMEGAVRAENPSSTATMDPASSADPSLEVQSTTAPKPVSPVVPRQSERLSEPPERYSPGLFFTDADEPTTYREAIEATDATSW